MFFFIKTPYIHSTRLAEMKLNREEDYYTVEGKSMIDGKSVRLTLGGEKSSLLGSIRDSNKRSVELGRSGGSLGIRKSQSAAAKISIISKKNEFAKSSLTPVHEEIDNE